MSNYLVLYLLLIQSIYSVLYLEWGWRVIGISRSLIWSETLMELIFNPCGEFRWNLEGPVSQIHSPHLHDCAPGIFSDLRSFQMLKREWGTESNEKLLHLFIPSKTATLVPKFAVKDLPLGRTLMMMMMISFDWMHPLWSPVMQYSRWIGIDVSSRHLGYCMTGLYNGCIQSKLDVVTF